VNPAAIRAAMPADVAGVMRALRTAGFGAYVVGGAVRDALVGRTPADWDLATEATPDQMRIIFPNAEYENRFGTVGVPTEAGIVREVTTFRADGASSDARRPDSIIFLQRIEGDLARRDFTINAMAFGLAPESSRRLDPVTDSALIDPYGGADDLAAGIVRAVGDPAERFREDALRMLRAIRFAARFELTIEPVTAAAIQRDAGLAARLSGERIGAEMDGVLAAARPALALQIAYDLGLIAAIAPALAADWADEIPKRVESIGGAAGTPAYDPLGRLAELFAQIVDDEDVAATLESWRRPRATIHEIRTIRTIDRMSNEAELAGGGRARAIDLRIAAAIANGDARDAARQLRRRIATGRASACATSMLAACEAADADALPAAAHDLAIDGDLLVAHCGEAPGAWVGELLGQLVIDAAHGRVPNTADALLSRAAEVRRSSLP